jgi:hypothetical protein
MSGVRMSGVHWVILLQARFFSRLRNGGATRRIESNLDLSRAQANTHFAVVQKSHVQNKITERERLPDPGLPDAEHA